MQSYLDLYYNIHCELQATHVLNPHISGLASERAALKDLFP